MLPNCNWLPLYRPYSFAVTIFRLLCLHKIILLSNAICQYNVVPMNHHIIICLTVHNNVNPMNHISCISEYKNHRKHYVYGENILGSIFTAPIHQKELKKQPSSAEYYSIKNYNNYNPCNTYSQCNSASRLIFFGLICTQSDNGKN